MKRDRDRYEQTRKNRHKIDRYYPNEIGRDFNE